MGQTAMKINYTHFRNEKKKTNINGKNDIAIQVTRVWRQTMKWKNSETNECQTADK